MKTIKKSRYADIISTDMWTRTGNVYFQAPEIFVQGGFNELVDIWSSGVLLYYMALRKLPFD